MPASDMQDLVKLIKTLARRISNSVNIMEVCGTHTAEIFRHGIRSILPDSIKLLSGPGCPVCVTPISDIDKIIFIAKQKETIVTTFGDMMRVPGSTYSLLKARLEGADIRVVYSPIESLNIAKEFPRKKIVFLSVGFETTAPLTAATIAEAEATGVENFYVYIVNKILSPALEALLQSEETQIGGFILPGHVSTITGSKVFDFIPNKYSIPAVITGFSAEDILTGIAMLLRQIYERRAEVEIQYSKAVKRDGNSRALKFIEEYFTPIDSYWRGIGLIKKSGLTIKREYKRRDITTFFNMPSISTEEPQGCLCGKVLRGIIIPPECKLFGTKCTPSNPVGACMVSQEGSCSIYYKYGSSL